MLKTKHSLLVVATASLLGASLVTPVVAQAALPSITIWVDSPRLPGAQVYAKIMKGKVNVNVQLHSQGDLVAKVQLFNTVKKGWPDVVFGPPNDVAFLKNPLVNDALQLDKLQPASVWKKFGNGNNWCVLGGHIYCVKNDLAQTVLWYNKTLMTQFSYKVPTTMDQYFAIGADLAKNHPGYSMGALGDQAAASGYLWPSQCPLNVGKSDTVVVINSKSPKCTRVAAGVQPLIDSGVLDTRSAFDAGYIKDVAQAGKWLMQIGPSWWGQFVLRPASSYNIPAGQVATANMPVWAGEKKAYSGEYGGGIYTVSPHSKFPKEALAFAMFMVADPRNLVTLVNPDGSHGAPTYPAFGPGNKLWTKAVAKDPYYAQNIVPALDAQAQLIWSGTKPVRYDANGAWGSSFDIDLAQSKNMQHAIDAYAAYTSNLAIQLGYAVVSK
jgi:ABC-type glycerol-3-phosphate transport system substrate-binding protein